jgi:hypothetical protein
MGDSTKKQNPTNTNRIRTLRKGIKRGYCRICGQYSELTADHIPPRSCGNAGEVNITIDGVSYISHDGFSCKTICGNCNNNLLGASHDLEFKKLYDIFMNQRLVAKENQKIILPALTVDVDIYSLLKGMLAHFLAFAAVNGDQAIADNLQMPVQDLIKIFNIYREFALSKRDKLDNFDIYYWYYPFSNIVISTWTSVTLNFFQRNPSTFMGSLIKYYPLALFIVEKNKDNKLQYPIHIIDWKMNQLSLDRFSIIPFEFPEHQMGSGIVITGNNSVVTVERKPMRGS